MIDTIKKAKEQGYKFKLEENDSSNYVAMFFKPSTETLAMEIYVAGDADLQKAVESAFSRIPTPDTSSKTAVVQEARDEELGVSEESTEERSSEDGSRGAVGGSMDVKSRAETLESSKPKPLPPLKGSKKDK